MPAAMTKPYFSIARRVAPGLMVATLLATSLGTGLAQNKIHRAQKHEIRHEIDQLEDQWRNAALKGDIPAMDSLLADDYMAITASGTLQTKDETLANLRSGRIHFTALEISDRKVRFYRSTALVTSVAEVKATTPDGDISGNYRYTRVYVRDVHGAWKIVSFEASRIGDQSEHK
jgi:ketosteroid isomerase-like protein